jgi:hypothetical protein
MKRSFVFACLLALLAPAMAAEKGPPLLDVLEFDAPPEVMDPDGLGILTDALLSAVKQEVGGRYKVLTRETMTEIIPPEKLKYLVDKCVAEIGRMLHVPYVVAGNVRSFGSLKVLTIEAYESNGGQLLGAEQIKGPNADALLDQLDEMAQGPVRTWFSLKPAPAAAAPAKVSEGRLGATDDFDVGKGSDVIASFDSEPAGAVVLVDGKVACKATPCTTTVAAGRHDVTMSLDQYDDAAQAVYLSAKRKSVHLELAALCAKEVVAKPLPWPRLEAATRTDGEEGPDAAGDSEAVLSGRHGPESPAQTRRGERP